MKMHYHELVDRLLAEGWLRTNASRQTTEGEWSVLTKEGIFVLANLWGHGNSEENTVIADLASATLWKPLPAFSSPFPVSWKELSPALADLEKKAAQ